MNIGSSNLNLVHIVVRHMRTTRPHPALAPLSCLLHMYAPLPLPPCSSTPLLLSPTTSSIGHGPLQVQSHQRRTLYSGPIDVIRKIYAESGACGIFAGYRITVLTREWRGIVEGGRCLGSGKDERKNRRDTHTR